MLILSPSGGTGHTQVLYLYVPTKIACSVGHRMDIQRVSPSLRSLWSTYNNTGLRTDAWNDLLRLHRRSVAEVDIKHEPQQCLCNLSTH